ncbi:Saposin-like protein [Pseudocohnilembus persalinus]|uniref:Saposin-like protein n=1 Tax=Pseudocohnilembus persalinus TaxID=266149 RepID=A0A0V0R4S1_PSEPJ|nr:Saposin-like protein [Pseudocohnilembus persalinus]|eukprot:KRX09475.1 Saposin-like protein [Pseudocohnilembus persalinus]
MKLGKLIGKLDIFDFEKVKGFENYFIQDIKIQQGSPEVIFAKLDKFTKDSYPLGIYIVKQGQIALIQEQSQKNMNKLIQKKNYMEKNDSKINFQNKEQQQSTSILQNRVELVQLGKNQIVGYEELVMGQNRRKYSLISKSSETEVFMINLHDCGQEIFRKSKIFKQIIKNFQDRLFFYEQKQDNIVLHLSQFKDYLNLSEDKKFQYQISKEYYQKQKDQQQLFNRTLNIEQFADIQNNQKDEYIEHVKVRNIQNQQNGGFNFMQSKSNHFNKILEKKLQNEEIKDEKLKKKKQNKSQTQQTSPDYFFYINQISKLNAPNSNPQRSQSVKSRPQQIINNNKKSSSPREYQNTKIEQQNYYKEQKKQKQNDFLKKFDHINNMQIIRENKMQNKKIQFLNRQHQNQTNGNFSQDIENNSVNFQMQKQEIQNSNELNSELYKELLKVHILKQRSKKKQRVFRDSQQIKNMEFFLNQVGRNSITGSSINQKEYDEFTQKKQKKQETPKFLPKEEANYKLIRNIVNQIDQYKAEDFLYDKQYDINDDQVQLSQDLIKNYFTQYYIYNQDFETEKYQKNNDKYNSTGKKMQNETIFTPQKTINYQRNVNKKLMSQTFAFHNKNKFQCMENSKNKVNFNLDQNFKSNPLFSLENSPKLNSEKSEYQAHNTNNNSLGPSLIKMNYVDAQQQKNEYKNKNNNKNQLNQSLKTTYNQSQYENTRANTLDTNYIGKQFLNNSNNIEIARRQNFDFNNIQLKRKYKKSISNNSQRKQYVNSYKQDKEQIQQNKQQKNNQYLKPTLIQLQQQQKKVLGAVKIKGVFALFCFSQQCGEIDILRSKIDQIELVDEFLNVIKDQFSQFIDIANQDAYRQKGSFEQGQSSLECTACRIAVQKIKRRSDLVEKLEEMIIDKTNDICVKYLLPYEVCHGVLSEQVPVIVESIWAHYVNEDFICPLKKYCDPVYEKIDIDELVKEILSDKPKQEPLIPTQKSTFKFIHWADIHTDFEYQVGAKVECEQIYDCCRETSGKAAAGEQGAEYWGSLAVCDVPNRTFQQMVQFVKKYLKNKVDFAIWTGDNTSHNVWAQSPLDNIANTVDQTAYITKELTDFQVYPIFGNHEGYPVNIFDYEQGSESEYKSLWSNLWSHWIDENAKEQLKNHGFYEQVVNSQKKLKVIALNTQSCESLNFYLIKNPTDPANMLQYLREALYKAEEEGYGVYLFYHVPSNGGCYNNYATVFSALVDRFSYTIRGQFSAHTHADELDIFYDKDGEAVNINWVAPSFTTFSNRNPSFRVFEADSETLQIVNVHQYRLDLNYWNHFTDSNTQLLWENAYDMVSEYKLENIYDYKNLDLLRRKVGSDLKTYNKYMFNYWNVFDQQIKSQVYGSSLY